MEHQQDCLLQGQAQLNQRVVFCFSTLRLKSKKLYPKGAPDCRRTNFFGDDDCNDDDCADG